MARAEAGQTTLRHGRERAADSNAMGNATGSCLRIGAHR